MFKLSNNLMTAALQKKLISGVTVGQSKSLERQIREVGGDVPPNDFITIINPTRDRR